MLVGSETDMHERWANIVQASLLAAFTISKVKLPAASPPPKLLNYKWRSILVLSSAAERIDHLARLFYVFVSPDVHGEESAESINIEEQMLACSSSCGRFQTLPWLPNKLRPGGSDKQHADAGTARQTLDSRLIIMWLLGPPIREALLAPFRIFASSFTVCLCPCL